MTVLSLEKQRYAADSEAQLKRVLASEGFSIFAWQDAPGAYYNAHSHGHDEFIVVHAGSIKFIIEGKTYELSPGDLLNLPAGTVHEAVNEGQKAVHYFICTRS
jgi:quercetin dioxygenase-like cupin family protein